MSGENSQAGRGPLGTPTPGQMALNQEQPDFQQPNSEEERSNNNRNNGSQRGDLGDPTPAQTMLRELQEQQDAMDTIRAGNTRQQYTNDDSKNNGNANLSELFKAPFLSPKEEEESEIEFEEAGGYDFREALLAEQRQQQALLQERQRSFEQHYGQIDAAEPGPSPQPSPNLTSKLPPKSPVERESRSLEYPTNLPKPSGLKNANRGISAPAGNATGAQSHKHKHTVSWSLDNLKTAPAENFGHRQSPSSKSAGINQENGSSQASFIQSRPRTNTEDTNVTIGKQKIDLKDIIGMAPFESEVETNILRALDEFGLQNQMSKAEGSKDEAVFFANLPSAFSLGDDLLGSDSELEKTPNDSGAVDGPDRTAMNNSSHHQKKASDSSAGNLSGRSTHKQKPSRPRPVLSQQGPSSRQLQQSSRNLQKKGPSTMRPRAHRYTQSVEQRLFGLTAQLSKIDQESLTSSHDSDSDDDSFAGEAKEDRRAVRQHRRVLSSADKVAEATHSLVQKAHKRDASPYGGGRVRRPSLFRGRTVPDDSDGSHHRDTSHHSGKSKRASMSVPVLHTRSSSPISDVEAQENAEQPTIEQSESNFSKWRLRRDPYPYHDDPSVGRQSMRSLGGVSLPRHHHAPTVIDEGDEDDGEHEPTKSERQESKMKRRKRRSRNRKKMLAEGFKEDWELFTQFLDPRRRSIWLYCKAILYFVVLPATGIATLLFYVFENPKSLDDDHASDVTEASLSWWFLFIGVRQVVTLSLAMAAQSFLIDYVALGSRFSLQLVGPVMTLLVVQSKGWPFVTVTWALFDLGMLAGSNRFVMHWGYWQDWVGLFNERNPSGEVTADGTYLQILRLAMILGALVAVKRLIVGLFLGRQTFVHYSEELAKVMKRMVLVSEVAALSREPLPENASEYLPDTDQFTSKNLTALMSADEGSTLSMHVSEKDMPDIDAAKNLPRVDDSRASKEDEPVGNPQDRDTTAEATQADKASNHSSMAGTAPTNYIESRGPPTSSSQGAPPSPTQPIPSDVPTSIGSIGPAFTPSERQTIMDLLERWEEPERFDHGMDKKVTLGAVLQFRRAITFLKQRYPFSTAFGPAETREICIESAEDLFDLLLLRRPGQYEDLNFETLAEIAAGHRGSFDEDKLKDLIKVFRPDRDGKLTRLAFVKSIDAVYKRMRMLSANIHNSSQIDIAVENLVNMLFYTIVGCIGLSRLGIDPLQLFFSFSSVILAFAFMFGSGAAKYFEGILLILLQRPYGVGDRIHVSNCQNEVSMDGQAGWIVEKVNLYNTTVRFATTNERATISNGSLASSRIINAARSPNAIIYVQLKFGIDVPYEKIMIFRKAAEQHVAARPREWLAFLGFRSGAISVDLGFITYTLIVQHREPWQNVPTILESKATLTAYCLEVAKQLGMRYRSPPLPVDLNVFNNGGMQINEELYKKYA